MTERMGSTAAIRTKGASGKKMDATQLRPEDLRACPSCRGVDTNTRGFRAGTVRYSASILYQVICSGCGCRGSEMDTREQARDAWNALPRKATR